MRVLIKNIKVSLIPIGVGFAAFVLATTLLVYLWQKSFGVWWYIIEAICCIAGATVVTWLGWCLDLLLESVASIARQLNKGGQSNENRVDFLNTADNIAGIVKEKIEYYQHNQSSLEEQIKQLQIQLQLAHRQKQNTDAIIYSIRDAVIVADGFDNLLMANEAAGKLFNFDYKNSQLRPINELVSDDKKEFIKFLTHCRETQSRANKREIEFIEGDKVRTFDCIVSCVYDNREQICGVVGVLHDVTKEKEISQMKNDFVSHVSHELKTPLASIMAYSEMLADGEANDENTRKEFYSIIQSQANRLNRLIEDILNTARIESGLIKIDKQQFSLTVLIEEQLEMIRGFAQEKNIKVISQKPIVFDQVYIDKDMMSQVIVNLLSNAVKYTKSGGKVTISTSVDETTSTICVKVADTGVGIPADAIDHVFDKFYRVKANEKQAKGTGLGLNLVKQIVEKIHDGQVFVVSKVGQGSTFGFVLPLARTTAGARA